MVLPYVTEARDVEDCDPGGGDYIEDTLGTWQCQCPRSLGGHSGWSTRWRYHVRSGQLLSMIRKYLTRMLNALFIALTYFSLVSTDGKVKCSKFENNKKNSNVYFVV